MKKGLFAILSVVAASVANAQERVTVDLRAVTANTVGQLANSELGTGFGLGGTLALRAQSHLHLYGGWDWVHFKPSQSFAGSNRDFEETGYTFGFRFEHPFYEGQRYAYRFEAGGVYKHLEIENEDGDVFLDSGHSFGVEAGGGLVLPLGGKWSVVPTARYRWLRPKFDLGSNNTTGSLRYFGGELAFSWSF